MKFIPLSRGLFTIVDDEDYLALSALKWFAFPGQRTFYAGRQIRVGPGKQRGESLHRFLMRPPSGMEVAYRNGIGLDNRRSNLRVCSHAQNTANYPKPKTNTSGFLGVSRLGRKWRAEFFLRGKNKYLGLFGTPEEAKKVRDSAVLAARKEFARL